MRVIWYMLDGLTPCVLQSLNGEVNVDNNVLAHFNYIDELAEGSFVIKKCYGYGETLASNSAMVTGLTSGNLKSDIPSHPDSFPLNPTLASRFKKNGYLTAFYRNFPLDGLRRYGPYQRYNNLVSDSFDHFCLEDDSKLLFKDSDILSKHDDFFFLKEKKPVFIFIHDMGFHDHPLVLKNATMQGVLKAVVESAERVKENLEYLNYDKNKDVLIFSSDHGMTLSPYDNLFYDKKISDETIEKYWTKLIADFKLRTCFFIKGSNIESHISNGSFEIRDMSTTTLDFLGLESLASGSISAKSQQRSSALVSVFESPYERRHWKNLKNLSHSYFVFVHDDKKWVYRRLGKQKCYFFDLKKDPTEINPEVIRFAEFPVEFQKYISNYFSISRQLARFIKGYNPKSFMVRTIKKVLGICQKLYKK